MNAEKKEPIAIVGIGCRFPGGANSPKAFWNLLKRGKDAIVKVPKDRWDIRRFYDENPDKPGKMYVKKGGFLKEKIDHFDPLFFGISPREAESLDPQQRLLLEVSWEAFEDAGITAEELSGSNTGVFIGGFCMDNMLLRLNTSNNELVNTHTAASSTMTLLSNRISYSFDLKGPSLTLDTACSSSLVAIHYACQSIRNQESSLAISGGVNVMLRPEFPIMMSKGKFLSHHGYCKAFDEDAAGYSRGEGAGVVVLKSLTKALQDRDRVYALIRETGVNQDGMTQGISVPSSKAQENLIKNVYARAGVSPGDVEYIEAHGTGTQAGDPKEAEALHNALSKNRPINQKCQIGSVKTNIGHLEAGAGVAGLIKTTLCLYNEKIVPSLHFDKPNPKIPFDDMCIQVSTRLSDWKRDDKPRYAGVNSFGYGGTNAHAILQEAPTKNESTEGSKEAWDGLRLFPISARDENALKELAGKYAFYLTTNSSARAFADFYYTATQRRTHHQHRAALLADSIDDLKAKLQRLSAGETPESFYLGFVEPRFTPKPIFIYTGMGPQWWAMGRELINREKVFHDSVRECDGIFQEESGWSILDALMKDEADSRMGKTEIAQPANFLIQVGLTSLLGSWGIEPKAVVGHSVGEVASAYVSGALSLKDAIKVSYHRSRLQQTLAGKGAMLAAGLGEEEALQLISTHGEVSIAAINSQNSVTLSGNAAQLKEIATHLEKKDIFHRELKVEVAYHSYQMDDINDELQSILSSIEPRKAEIPLYSTVTGSRIEGELLKANYWWQNVREPVRFCSAIEALLSEGYRDFIEVGPHPVLGHSVKEITAEKSRKINLFQSLNRKFPEHQNLLSSLAQLYCQGYPINWQAITTSTGGLVSIPSYPWQRNRHWDESDNSIHSRLGESQNPFQNIRVQTPLKTWAVELNNYYFPFLNDHKVNGKVVFPGAGYVEAGLVLHRDIIGGECRTLTDLVFHSMLEVEVSENQEMSLSLDEDSSRFQIHSRNLSETSSWTLHASGNLIDEDVGQKIETINIEEIKEKFNSQTKSDELYLNLDRRGLNYSKSFRNIEYIYVNDHDSLAFVRSDRIPAYSTQSVIFPEILDAAFQAALSILDDPRPFVPVAIKKFRHIKSLSGTCWVYSRIIVNNKHWFLSNIQLFDDKGSLCIEISDLKMVALSKPGITVEDLLAKKFYTHDWKRYNSESRTEYTSKYSFIIFNNNASLCNSIEEQLQLKNASFVNVSKGEHFSKEGPKRYLLNENDPNDFQLLFDELKDLENCHFLYLWAVANSKADEPDLDIIISEYMILIRLIKGLNNTSKLNGILTIFTIGSQCVDHKEGFFGLNTTALWGLTPLIQSEYENIECRLVDLDPTNPDINGLENEVLFERSINELAIRDGVIYTRKLDRFSYEERSVIRKVSTEEPVALNGSLRGISNGVSYMETVRKEPESTQVEIKVDSVCLNSIWQNGSGRIEDYSDSSVDREVRLEVSGKILKTGNQVKEFEKGDHVVAVTGQGVKSYLTIPAENVIGIPQNIRANEFFINLTHLVANYALCDVAKLNTGEKILINDAGSDIGLAAIQAAQHLGAEIYATTKSEQQREYIENLGVKCITDIIKTSDLTNTRSSATPTEVDVVFNPPTGDLERNSVSLLAPFGRFIEIRGQNNSAANNVTFNGNSITFSIIDIDQVRFRRHDLAKNTINQIKEQFLQGSLKPLPNKIYPAKDITDAASYVSDPQRIGQVVVSLANEYVEATSTQTDKSELDLEGTYLITGGNSGFGLEVASWLAENGATKIVLGSRSVPQSDNYNAKIRLIEGKGAEVVSEKLDVTNFDLVKRAITGLLNGEPPLKGIVHGAMVLDDAFLEVLTEEKMRRVLEPKILGLLNLYHAVKDSSLEFLVSFSSVSALIGNRGQSNYIAANVFLDTFSEMVSSNGFPMKSINWGALSESGIVERNQTIGKLLEQEGIKGISNAEALKSFEEFLKLQLPRMGVFDIDWNMWRTANPSPAKSSKFSNLISTINSNGESSSSLADSFAEYDELTLKEMIEQKATESLCDLLKIPADRLHKQQDLGNLGIDSLLLLELSLIIQSDFRVKVSATELSKHKNISELADTIIAKFGKEKALLSN